MDATSLASVWALIGLVLFIALVVYFRAPAMIGKALDDRADRIRKELDEARNLREEAQQLLAEYQRKRKEAEQEAAELVEAARREADAILAEAKEKSEEYVARRSELAEAKIAQAEREAINEVRSNAVSIAVAAAGKLLQERIDEKATAELFRNSLDTVKSRMH